MPGFVMAPDAVTDSDFAETMVVIRILREKQLFITATNMLRVAAILHIVLLENGYKYDAGAAGRLAALNEIKIGRKSFREIAETWPPNLRRYFR